MAGLSIRPFTHHRSLSSVSGADGVGGASGYIFVVDNGSFEARWSLPSPLKSQASSKQRSKSLCQVRVDGACVATLVGVPSGLSRFFLIYIPNGRGPRMYLRLELPYEAAAVTW